MEYAVRRFARNVLLIHVGLLLALFALVALAAHEVYQSARAHTLQQAEQRQSLLAEQTARGIQSLYESVLSDLQLMHPVDPDDPDSAYAPASHAETRPAVRLGRQVLPSAILSQQLEGRLSHLFLVDKATLQVRWSGIGAAETAPSVRQIIARTGPWLRTLEEPAISQFQLFGERGLNLICIPMGGLRRSNILVAAIPTWRIERRFLDDLNRHNVASAFLVDDSMTLVAAAHHDLVGSSLEGVKSDSFKSALASLVTQDRRGTRVLSQGFAMGSNDFGPAMLTARPVRVSDKQWFVLISSPLAEVDLVVGQVFRRAALWAIFVICSMTAILVSTAAQLIRGRARLERMRHEVLTREMQEARRIQLAWLPERNLVRPGLQIATVNHPASHISGDFYNFFDLPDGRTALVIGDVTGHGMAAAFLMATAQLLVRTTLPGLCDPGACLAEVNRQLCVQIFSGQFVTMLIAVLDRAAGKLYIASAGHPTPLIHTGAGFESLTFETGLVLGVERGSKYQTHTADLPSRATLLFYTDGVVEAQGPDDSRLGVPGLAQGLRDFAHSAEDLIDTAVRTVTDFRRGQPLKDDMTLLAAAIEPVGDHSHEYDERAGRRTESAPAKAAPPMVAPDPISLALHTTG